MLDITAEVAKLQQMYKDKRGAERYHALVYGEKGSGKTTLLRTARLPVHVDSFDPGGTLALRDEIEAGIVVADSSFENEDPLNPTAYVLWDREFHRRKREGYFDNFATYSIDSLTTFSQAILNAVLKRDGRPATIPKTGKGEDNDYVHQMLILENSLAGIFSLPCDLIVTAHPETEKDEILGKIDTSPAITGKAKRRIPLLFSEVYYALCADSKDGTEWKLLTRLSSHIKASTRLGKDGKFDKFEKPNIKALLKKANLPYHDLPIPWLKKP